MPVPTLHINISGNVLAVYGAVLATITAAVQVVSHYKDRVLLVVSVQHKMEIIGDARYIDVPLTIMKVVNGGRRPVTITGVGAYRLSPLNPFVIADTIPPCPCELTEGKQLTAMVNEKHVDLSVMESWEAYTSTGKTFRKRVVPWYRGWLNRRRLRKKAMEKGK